MIKKIESIIQETRDLKDKIEALMEEARSLALQVKDKEDLTYIYWNVPEISTSTLAKAVGETSIFRFLHDDHINPKEKECTECGETIEIKSKSKYDDVKDKDLTCKKCVKIKNIDSDNRHKERQKIYWARREELKTMPYKKYLKTKEWNETRAQHLEEIGYKCQLCNQGDKTIDIHHRTYERRGEEKYTDLFGLCRPCHSKHHNKVVNGN